MIALDEDGGQWLVEKGDPAYDACQKVVKAGLVDIVLPRKILLHGILPGYNPLHTNPPTGEKFLRWCRMWDSLRALDLV